MTRAVTVQAVLDELAPERRARLLAINPHLAPPTAANRSPASARHEPVVHVTGATVRGQWKGLRLVSEANSRDHFRTRAARAKAQRAAIGAGLARVTPPSGPWRVTITRQGPGILDTDNLAGSAKAVRDAVAQWLGVDDGPASPVTWETAQERARGYSVVVVVEGKL